jgi:Tol biopolymer transport system component
MRNPARKALPLLLLSACFALGAGSAASASVGEMVLVADSGGEDYGELDSVRHRPAISADGRFLAYVFQSGTFPGPGESAGDPLFLHDLRRGTTTQVVRPSEQESTWGFDSETPVLSADGRYLAFASSDPELSDDDVDAVRGATGRFWVQDVFVFDRKTRRVKLVSRRGGSHGEPSNGDSSRPSISDDGRYVAYVSDGWNLAPPGPTVPGGVFGRDLQTESNRMISGAAGIMFWHPASFWPDLSGDGERVAFGFQYSARPYDPKHPPQNVGRWLRRRHKQIMVTDSGWKRPQVASRASGRRGALANANCNEPSASGSGRFVAFTTEADNLVRGDRNDVEDVFVRDLRRGVTTLISRRGKAGAPGNEASALASISANGRYVAFQSEASNLVAGDADDKVDVFVKDLKTGRMTLVSRAADGSVSDGRSGVPVITPDGRYVAFGSSASNLVPGRSGHDHAIYRYQLLP